METKTENTSFGSSISKSVVSSSTTGSIAATISKSIKAEVNRQQGTGKRVDLGFFTRMSDADKYNFIMVTLTIFAKSKPSETPEQWLAHKKENGYNTDNNHFRMLQESQKTWYQYYQDYNFGSLFSNNKGKVTWSSIDRGLKPIFETVFEYERPESIPTHLRNSKYYWNYASDQFIVDYMKYVARIWIDIYTGLKSNGANMAKEDFKASLLSLDITGSLGILNSISFLPLEYFIGNRNDNVNNMVYSHIKSSYIPFLGFAVDASSELFINGKSMDDSRTPFMGDKKKTSVEVHNKISGTLNGILNLLRAQAMGINRTNASSPNTKLEEFLRRS